MDLWQLHIFCKVVENRSFSRAGQVVHLSQPTISSHIKDLETHFQCQLIDRLSTAAVPTPAGEILYGYARRLLSLKAEMASALSEFLGSITGHLTIGGSTIPGNYILPGLMGQFSAAYPGVRMSLVVEDTASIIRHVACGDMEVGVVGARAEDVRIDQDAFIEDEMALVVPAGHLLAKRSEVTLDELQNTPFIIRESGSGTRQSFEARVRASGHSVDQLFVVAEMGSTEAVIQAIRGGLGVSILSKLAVREGCARGQLSVLSIIGIDLKRHFYLTRHRQRTLSPTSRAFIAFLTAIPPTQ